MTVLFLLLYVGRQPLLHLDIVPAPVAMLAKSRTRLLEVACRSQEVSTVFLRVEDGQEWIGRV